MKASFGGEGHVSRLRADGNTGLRLNNAQQMCASDLQY
jgi:hypothetical protein